MARPESALSNFLSAISYDLGAIILDDRGQSVSAHNHLTLLRSDDLGLPHHFPARFDDHPLPQLEEEFEHLRRSHIGFFRHLHGDDWNRIGTANGKRVTVRALA